MLLLLLLCDAYIQESTSSLASPHEQYMDLHMLLDAIIQKVWKNENSGQESMIENL